MKTQLNLPTEKQVQDSLIGYLRIKGYYVQRLNSGAMRMQSNGKDYMLRLAAAGTPDLLAIKEFEHKCSEIHGFDYAAILFIEVKRSPKHKATPLQLAKMEELETYGARCIVASSIEDLQREGI